MNKINKNIVTTLDEFLFQEDKLFMLEENVHTIQSKWEESWQMWSLQKDVRTKFVDVV